MYDRSETNSYKKALGEWAYRIPISATKSMTGQPYAAGGILSAGAALMALDSGVIPPTINLENPDPICDLDFVPRQARLNDVDTTLVTALSFGGTHNALVMRRMN
jgi:3-oxoacyl-[acyl-carrier-protein] synthase II